MGSPDGTRAWCDTGQPRQRFQKYRWLADRCPRVALKHGFARHTSEETTTRSFESGSPDASAFVGSNPGGRPSDSIRRAGVIQERLAKALWANGVGSPYGELVELFPGHSKRPDARTYSFR